MDDMSAFTVHGNGAPVAKRILKLAFVLAGVVIYAQHHGMSWLVVTFKWDGASSSDKPVALKLDLRQSEMSLRTMCFVMSSFIHITQAHYVAAKILYDGRDWVMVASSLVEFDAIHVLVIQTECFQWLH